MDYKKILVVFKTHLDVGFTDYSENVVNRYFTKLMPAAIKVANGKMGKTKNGFVWSTGSWLIYEYLKKAGAKEKADLEKALKAGTISWHALPFTTHTECMDKKLFEYGISLSEKLDKEFGKKTVSAKMTDVPGHTKAMIPILARHGVEFLHIGVNPACVSKRTYNPVLEGLYLKDQTVVLRVKFGKEATEEYGCPKIWEIRYNLADENQVGIDVIWADKQATRVTEAIWFGFNPKGENCYVQKLGEWINCSDVVERGGRCIWGTDFGFKTEKLLLKCPDSSLISCGTDTLLNFDRRKAHPARGMLASLYTNIWASNFPLWNDEDASFRFVLKKPK